MDIFLLICSIALYAAGVAFQKIFSDSMGTSRSAPLLFASMWSGVVCLAYIAAVVITKAYFISSISVYTALMMGICASLSAYLTIEALRTGPLSLSMLIISMCVVIPVILSAVFMEEHITPLQMIGFLLILVVFVLANGSRGENGKKVTFRWFSIALLCCLLNGAVMFIEKVQQTAMQGREVPQFMALVYGISTVFSLIIWYFLRRKESDHYTCTKNKFYLPMLGAAASIGGCNFLILILSSRLPAVVLFPTFQCGSLLVSSLMSFLFFHEKGNLRTYVSVALGAAAVVILNL